MIITVTGLNNARQVIWAIRSFFSLSCFLYTNLYVQAYIGSNLQDTWNGERWKLVRTKKGLNDVPVIVSVPGEFFYIYFFHHIFDTNTCFIVYKDWHIQHAWQGETWKAMMTENDKKQPKVCVCVCVCVCFSCFQY